MRRSEIKKLIVSARNAELRKREVVCKLIENLEDIIDINLDDIPNNSAENADTLLQAINCHIDYGECDLEELLDDIQMALVKRRTGND